MFFRRLGGLFLQNRRERELRRDGSTLPWLETFAKDVRYGGRMLLKNPGFTIVAVMTLALGIGANTAIFSLVDGVLLKPLSYQDPGSLVTVLHENQGPVAPANFLDFQAESKSFEGMGAAEAWGGILTGERPEAVSGIRFSEGMFEVLGVAPLLGRTFQADDFRQPSRLLVLGHSLWQRRFGGTPEIVDVWTMGLQIEGRPLPMPGQELDAGAVGIYGVMAYAVTQRRHEIGIRMALGARRMEILALVLQEGMKLTGVGILLGLAGAAALTQLLVELLYGVKPADPLTFLGVSLFLAAVALLACWLPARRAARLDPVTVLRQE